ncbi:hypothetical protein [Nonomuraea sp. NPDC049725]|uniref:hypothetical protein n=1 Tax=Nonomuraea sp. NPDC049725 TaxID=3154508 RepID=UPI003421EE87
MNAATKLGAYVLGLAVVFGGALGVGNMTGPVVGEPPAEHHAAATKPTESHGGGHQAEQTKNDTPGGLQVSEKGYTLNPLTTLKAGKKADFRFTVTDAGGEPVTDYQVQHDKKMHFIVVSRDLDTFQHVHPEMAADGVWSVPLTLESAGAYRAFADFAPTGGEALTLGADLLVAGDHEPKALPEETRTSTVDGYEVKLDGDLAPGSTGKLTLTVSKDGKPVTDLEPYLGAYGHLVALRAGDLAYLHVHPDGEPGDGKTKPGPEIVFYAEAPSAGGYRLFLDFQHEGKVRTADFTLRTGPATGAPTPDVEPTGHGEHSH